VHERLKGRKSIDISRLDAHISAVVRENLTMAMGITLAENRVDLLGDRLFIEDACAAAGPIVWDHASASGLGPSICGARM